MLGQLLLGAFWASTVLAAFALVERGWPRGERSLRPLERASTVLAVSLLVAIAANWALSGARALTAMGLLLATLLLAGTALWSLAKTGSLRWPELPRGDARVNVDASLVLAIAVFAIGFGWLVYAVIRAVYLPVLNHDALAYHLPKAVMIWWAKGARFFEAADGRISYLGSNYELLVADVLVATGSDKLSLLPSSFAFFAATTFGASFAERWWGKGTHALLAATVTASAPVMLLQSVAHKNDIFVSVLLLAALFGTARWLLRGERAGMVLAVASLFAALGTKVTAVFALAGLVLAAASMLPRIDRRAVLRDLPWLAVVSLMAFFAFGGMTYVWNLLHDHSLTGHLHDPVFVPRWRRFVNIPLTLYLMVARAFDPDSRMVWIAWRGARWFAPRYELYFSDVGVPALVALFLAPVVSFRARRDQDDEAMERRLVVRGAVLGALLSLPLEMGPLGSCAAYFRYVVFALPPIAACASGILARSSMVVRHVVLGAAALGMTTYAVLCAVRDRFAPLSYVMDAMDKPTRLIPISPNRPGSLVDLNAPRDAHVAVDADLDTWFYPAWGEQFTRRLTFIPAGDGPVSVPDDATYVMIDRPWRVIWNAADRDMGFHMPGRPSPEDTRVYHALLRDPRFRLVWKANGGCQAVFVRAAAGPMP